MIGRHTQMVELESRQIMVSDTKRGLMFRLIAVQEMDEQHLVHISVAFEEKGYLSEGYVEMKYIVEALMNALEKARKQDSL